MPTVFSIGTSRVDPSKFGIIFHGFQDSLERYAVKG